MNIANAAQRAESGRIRREYTRPARCEGHCAPRRNGNQQKNRICRSHMRSSSCSQVESSALLGHDRTTRGALDVRQGSGAAEGPAGGEEATYHAATGGKGTRDQPGGGASFAERGEAGRRPGGGAPVARKTFEPQVTRRAEAASGWAVSPAATGQAVARLRPDVGRGRTGGRAWADSGQRDAAAMAHGGGVVEGTTGAGGTGAHLAGTPRTLGRTAAVGHQRTHWLEGRSREPLYLIAMMDDASSRARARFVRHDSTEENLRLLGSYLEKHGRPLAFYTDKASLFQTTPKAAHHRDAPATQPTQIGRALSELDIEWIAAHSPQAKGRIERFFGTAQDRLVKGLRKVQARTVEEANAYLEEIYLPRWNQRFPCQPRQAGDAHRALDAGTDLASVLSRVERRTVAQDYTVRWQAAAYQIRRQDIGGGMRGAPVAIEQLLDGTVWMRWRDGRLRLQHCAEVSKPNYRPRSIPLPAAQKPD